MNILQPFFNVFRFHKFKLFFIFLSFLASVVLIFPYNDLGDFVTREVAEITNNQVFVQFEQMGFDLLPQVGLAVEKVEIETAQFPPLKADYLSIAPSLLGLISFRPGFSLKARGLMKGNVNLVLKAGEKLESGDRKQIIDFEAEDVDIQELGELTPVPMKIQGQMETQTTIAVDPGFIQQPEGNLSLSIRPIKILTVPTPMGTLSFNSLNFSILKIKGRMSTGKLIIEEGELGSPQDPIRGRIKGEMDLRFQRQGNMIDTDPGMYDLKVELVTKGELPKELRILQALLGRAETKTLNGYQYLFKVSGSGMQSNLEPISKF